MQRARLTPMDVRQQAPELTVIGSDQFYRVGEAEFGMPGLIAIESAGPFVRTRQIGPFVTIHDSVFEPGFGIGHHPHRYHERLFYILDGRVEHDDALNGIKGEMDTLDLGRLTEGVRGMYHQEWNGAPPGQRTRAFILVYRPDAVPEIPTASFDVHRAADRPRYADGDGETTELIGSKAPFQVNLSTFRRYLDTTVPAGGSIQDELADDEAVYLHPLVGTLRLSADDGASLGELSAEGSQFAEGPGSVGVLAGPGSIRMTAGEEQARVLRAVFAR
jgi:redox-sensitive bicupin YhaK (pirin superfamily)